MRIVFISIFWISIFIIFWANVGYPLSVLLLGKLMKKQNSKNTSFYPNVTVMVVAHNEESVIRQKLENLSQLEYPKDKISFLVSSDNSTDKTNSIVEQYISDYPNSNVSIYKVKKRMGKTNAQNEAQKIVKTPFLVMTDANSMLAPNSISHLMSSFEEDDIAYVTGKLIYTNEEDSQTSESESTYWNLDLQIREVESNFQTITAGNGALYAVRNSEYVDFDPIKSHDSSMPIHFALQGKRAIANHDAIAYEKAGENTGDEFNRKVRMNRVMLSHILPSYKILNVFKLKWFSYFYLGHRTSRYLLWLAHLLLLLSNVILALSSNFFLIILILHLLIIGIAMLHHIFNFDNRLSKLIYYYCVTIIAQYVGIYRILSGKSKPFWEKAESTR